MPNLGMLIDGRYACTYDAVDIGFTENGFDLIQSVREEVIDESDQYGGAIIDYFYRGGNCQLRADSKEYKAGSIAPYWPFGAAGQMVVATNPIGIRASDVASAAVLTSTPNTPAAAAPATLTATYAILAPGQQSTLLFNSKLRRVPIFLQLLPYTSGSNVVWYSST